MIFRFCRACASWRGRRFFNIKSAVSKTIQPAANRRGTRCRSGHNGQNSSVQKKSDGKNRTRCEPRTRRKFGVTNTAANSPTLLEMQTEIAREISAKLKLKLTAKRNKKSSRNATRRIRKAFKFYLKGRYFWNKRAAEWMKKGIENFQHALDCDPNLLRLIPVWLILTSLLRPSELCRQAVAIPKAKAAAQKALEIDERLAEAHAALGFIKNNYDWNWQESEAHFKRAVEINPNYAIAYHWHGFCLTARRRFAESIELMKQAQSLDPLSPIINTVCGLPFYYMRRYERAIKIYKDALENDEFVFSRTRLSGNGLRAKRAV